MWQALIDHAMHAGREPVRAALLELVAAEPLGIGLDTQRLVRSLPEGARVEQLPQRLTALVQQAVAQEQLLAGAVKAAEADAVMLMKQRHVLMSRGVRLGGQQQPTAVADGAEVGGL